jgi:hypothetical protein
MSGLVVQLTKRADGATVLRCVRADGSTTWQRQERGHARHFSLHDLGHYVVETELGLRQGFYGLIADGWDIEDTTGKGARGPLPAEALVVEYIVGALDVERAGGSEWSAEDFNAQTANYFAGTGSPAPRPLSDAELSRVRSRIAELHTLWWQLPPGETLELRYERDATGHTVRPGR